MSEIINPHTGQAASPKPITAVSWLRGIANQFVRERDARQATLVNEDAFERAIQLRTDLHLQGMVKGIKLAVGLLEDSNLPGKDHANHILCSCLNEFWEQEHKVSQGKVIK